MRMEVAVLMVSVFFALACNGLFWNSVLKGAVCAAGRNEPPLSSDTMDWPATRPSAIYLRIIVKV